ncbi:hypothetical protein Mag101_07435 [Microbulbifer agarilyticus]|uniref:Uncharacterized protein n=1 Tax=Microbulbifer agarilyticus TaxID=260552 RepID=A0A1Q2M4A8_9GAMM|nr:phage minor tail protein G [Microbulbifer agarilyticus]AQQ67490.1 hypothetical protein Mag101_07435 [Microbulbifer agarilyticus]
MSLFVEPLLSKEVIEFSGHDFELYELSAYDRCEYLEAITRDIAIPKDIDSSVEAKEFESYGELWSFRRQDVDDKLLLIAYSLRPGRSETLEELHGALRDNVTRASVDQLYIPAARLSGLYVEKEGGEDDEDTEKKG